MTAYAREAIAPDPSGGHSVFQAVQAVGQALYGDMAFDPEATDVDTDAAEAFRVRRGVCQDFSHIMIACLRGIGIPAGYVSGFLRTIPPPGKARLEGRGCDACLGAGLVRHRDGLGAVRPDQRPGGRPATISSSPWAAIIPTSRRSAASCAPRAGRNRPRRWM